MTPSSDSSVTRCETCAGVCATPCQHCDLARRWAEGAAFEHHERDEWARGAAYGYVHGQGDERVSLMIERSGIADERRVAEERIAEAAQHEAEALGFANESFAVTWMLRAEAAETERDRLADALRAIAGEFGCSRDTHHDCWHNGRTIDAEFMEDRACDQCIALRALSKPTQEAQDASPRKDE